MADLPSASSAADAKVQCVPQMGGEKVWVLTKSFDLDDLLATKLEDGDVVNLLTVPANQVLMAAYLEVEVAQTGGTGTCTLTTTDGTNNLVAALSISATGRAGPVTATFPVSNGTSDSYIEMTAAIGGGTVTVNPTVKLTLVGVDCA